MAAFILLRLFAVLALVAANAFFVAAEFALVSIRDTRIQQLIDERRLGARTIQKLQHHLDEFLPAVQFGVTLASLALGWIGEPAAAAILQPFVGNSVFAHTLAIVLGFGAITYMHVILGELVPKSLALQRAERVALAVAGPMDVFMSLSRPLLYAMKRSANLVLRGFGSVMMREGGVHSPEELKLIVTASRRVGLLPESQEDMIHRALDLRDISVREIMVPRHNIFSFPADMPLEEAMARVVEEQHSRIPIYEPRRGPEHIIGLLYSKDLSRLMHLKLVAPGTSPLLKPGVTVRSVMRDVLVVPETKPVTDLLNELKLHRRHLAVVVDEFGSTTGLVTVEDAIEQLVGEIEDEFDVAETPFLKLDGGAMVLQGSETVRDLESRHDLALPRNEGYETLGGFMLAKLGKIPAPGEYVDFETRRFTVQEMDRMRVATVKVEARELPDEQNPLEDHDKPRMPLAEKKQTTPR